MRACTPTPRRARRRSVIHPHSNVGEIDPEIGIGIDREIDSEVGSEINGTIDREIDSATYSETDWNCRWLQIINPSTDWGISLTISA